MNFHIEPLQETHFERLHQLFDAVCREKRFMAFTQAGSTAQTFDYYRQLLGAQETHCVAVQGPEVLGWCDVVRPIAHVRQHVGTLGMAVRASHRGQGVGRALIEAALAHAAGRGLTRIELTVHAQNTAAQALYRSVGFEVEGVQRRAWCIDGQCFDVLAMAKLSESPGAARA